MLKGKMKESDRCGMKLSLLRSAVYYLVVNVVSNRVEDGSFVGCCLIEVGFAWAVHAFNAGALGVNSKVNSINER